MKKRTVRLLGVLLSVVLSASALAGCGGNGSENSANKVPASAASGSGNQEKISLDILRSVGTPVPSGDADVIRTALEKALNVSIKMESSLGGDDYNNQLNVRLAGGNAPDIFQVGSRQILMDCVNKNLVLEMTPYLDKLDTYQKAVDKDARLVCYLKDKLYAWATRPNGAYGALWIRKDWLDNLSLKEPTTLDEMAEVAKKFTENDPDGNGQKDTYGLGGSDTGAFIAAFSGYGVPNPGETYIADGKVQNSLYVQGTQDALTYIYQNFVKPKSIDPEIISNTGNQAKDKAFQGKFGMMQIDWANMTKDQYAAQIKQINPKAEWEQVSPLKGPGGTYAGPVPVNNGVYVFAIPKTLEKDTQKVDRICQLINYCSDGEGLDLVQFGTEGVHYNKDSSGKITATDQLAKDGGYFWVYQFAGRPDESYLKVKFAKQTSYFEFEIKQPRIITYDSILDLPEGYNSNDAKTYINEQIVKFMYGQQPIGDYPKFISTLESQFNYKSYVSSAEQQLKELGVVK